MEIIGIILLIAINIILTYIFKFITGSWASALFSSAMILIVVMLSMASLAKNKYYKEGVKEYLQHPERYSIKVIYEDSIPVDTIVELK